MAFVRGSGDLRGKPVTADQQSGQPLGDPSRDLVLVVGAADDQIHLVDEGLQVIMLHGSTPELAHRVSSVGSAPLPRRLKE
ncbi:hypothetical protein OUY22_27995 [Nonomuraea sp. MCN248]|uniref:Uncharacterized protein n=1 Tax=Nonomuraea corallina TaxID=2989783 RepID=A0ABT4SJR9_9ACTN|nr:hypothetical protein [Nonomuraea corallina]MDA0637263.1 hypothetical protein [Nonomuraea corallina]